jgi:hypothetical protein
MFRFLLRIALTAAAFGIGGVALRRWLEQQNESLVGAGSPASASPPPATTALPTLKDGQKPAKPPAPDRSTSSSGPTGPAFDSLSREELYERAQAAGVKGRSKMNKAELAEAVARAELGGG